jgi:hypothetical protein
MQHHTFARKKLLALAQRAVVMPGVREWKNGAEKLRQKGGAAWNTAGRAFLVPTAPRCQRPD